MLSQRVGRSVVGLWKISSKSQPHNHTPELKVVISCMGPKVTTRKPEENLTESLVSSFEQLSTKDQSVRLLYNFAHSRVPRKEYRLPTVYSNNLQKKTILDPTLNISYRLPTLSSTLIEKFTPALEKLPVEDPSPTGRPVIEKSAAWLIQVRKRKMKKHKLRKLRKRMIFVNRRNAEIKAKKKEKALMERRQQLISWGEEFDPAAFVSKEMAVARKGGWSVEPIQTWKQTSTK